MCGIAGIYNTSQCEEELYHIGQDMIEQIRHRGPDASGVVVRSGKQGGKTLLAHARLSIIDLSKAGIQPMCSDDKTLWIVFNGEIYNYLELRSELEDLGVNFHSKTDTEVILASYKMWGLDCFERFIGMWALALLDENSNKLILSRDRLGIKPLFFSKINSAFVFGSEPKVIFNQLEKGVSLNPQAISDYFSYRYVLGAGSFFREIESVEPGTHLIFQGGEVSKFRYWDLPVATQKNDPGEEEVLFAVDELLNSSISYRMIADVPVGSYLSGGLDSSALVATMATKHSKPIKTFTIGFQEKGFNEFGYARQVAEYCQTDHKEIVLDADEYLSDLLKMIRIKDAPLAVPNEIALHKLSKILKQDITVVLSGEGADELFGGYGRIFRSAYDYQRIQAVGKNGLSAVLAENLTNKYSDLNWKCELDHFLNQYSYIGFDLKESVFSKSFLSSLGEDRHNCTFFRDYFHRLEGLDLHDKYIWLFQKIHLQGLLGRLDSATMSASVEGRVPFVDHRLIEYINCLPLHYKMRWLNPDAETRAQDLNSNQISESLDITKYVLRSLFHKRLPPEILERRKVGFPVPLGKWLSGPLQSYARDRLLNPQAYSRDLFNQRFLENMITDPSSQSVPNAGMLVWMMVNIEDWMQEYNISV